VDLTGKTVAVIGTGSSAIQSIPQIASRQAPDGVSGTPNFSLPAHNTPTDPAWRRTGKQPRPNGGRRVAGLWPALH